VVFVPDCAQKCFGWDSSGRKIWLPLLVDYLAGVRVDLERELLPCLSHEIIARYLLLMFLVTRSWRMRHVAAAPSARAIEDNLSRTGKNITVSVTVGADRGGALFGSGGAGPTAIPWLLPQRLSQRTTSHHVGRERFFANVSQNLVEAAKCTAKGIRWNSRA
jgi:hypothetical protein